MYRCVSPTDFRNLSHGFDGLMASALAKEPCPMHFQKETCRALVAALLVLSFQGARAEPAPATSERQEAVAQLQAAGVDPVTARERVAALDDDEARALARDATAAPAGGVAPLGWVAISVAAGMLYFLVVRK
jgi:uncharacterized protein YbjT (DUF2867 family)